MYSLGTRREVAPKITLERLKDHWTDVGITRCADLTGLDVLGIPVFAAFTPANPALQLSWGKGCRPDHARVSALMEAVERAHHGRMTADRQRASTAQLLADDVAVLAPSELQFYRQDVYFDETCRIDWIRAQSAFIDDRQWYLVPATALLSSGRRTNGYSANGLASGNSLAEALTHGMCEIIERHNVSRCFDERGRLQLKSNGTRLIDLTHGAPDLVAELNESIRSAGARLLLFLLPTAVDDLNTFWAVILDENNPLPFIRVNLGYGTHLSSEIAAVRAITEAAQSRMAFLHGCREDMAHRMRRPQLESIMKTCAYFASFAPSATWSDAAKECLGNSIEDDGKKILAAIRKAGFSRVLYRTIESVIPLIHIVRVLIPGALLRSGVF